MIKQSLSDPPQSQHAILKACDWLVLTIGKIGAWTFFLIGMIVAYEVVARYVFNSPTHWVEEISRLGMVWGTFLLMATCLNRRQLITITILPDSLGAKAKFVQELATFALVGVLAAVIAWYGFESMMQTISVNRRTNSTMSLPYWAFYLPIIIGFALFFIQATADLIVMLMTGRRSKPGFGHEEI
ncbi:TRAP transporter small permease [Roseovarius aestuarii]|nr:TRAP transporter small permease [Roseovarius aestuarii]